MGSGAKSRRAAASLLGLQQIPSACHRWGRRRRCHASCPSTIPTHCRACPAIPRHWQGSCPPRSSAPGKCPSGLCRRCRYRHSSPDPASTSPRRQRVWSSLPGRPIPTGLHSATCNLAWFAGSGAGKIPSPPPSSSNIKIQKAGAAAGFYAEIPARF